MQTSRRYKLYSIVGVVVMCVTLFWKYPYQTYREQQVRHQLQQVMLALAVAEHQYYLDHYRYTQNIADLNVTVSAYVDTNFPYNLSIANAIDTFHDFTIVARHQNETEDNNLLCPYMTLNQAGRWCAQTQCDSRCWAN